MSLILDALRKMELERQAKRQTSKEVRTEVLNYRGVAPASAKPGLIPVTAVILTVFVTAACFFFFSREESVKSSPAKNAELVKPPEPRPIITSQPLPPPPTTKRIPAEMKTPAEPPRPAVRTENAVRKTGDVELTVSGIAWQEERSLRRAVINGALVGEGAEILGARIVEIKENRIRFSRGAELFEVVHSAGSGR